MAQSTEFFSDVRDIMKLKFLWFDQPNTLFGKFLKSYSVFRLFATFVMILTAMSQIYLYGMSYVIHDSVVFVPLGWTALPEREIINNELMDNRRKTYIIVKALEYYVMSTGFVHFGTIASHYFFGVPHKPVVLPLVYEKFLEGNLELRPILIIVVLLSLIYINLLQSFSGYLALTFYVMKAPVGIMKALTNRLELATEKSGNGIGRLPTSIDLGDTIQKHNDLLEVVHDMMAWNAFPLAYVASLSTLLFCLNAITFKQALGKNEFYSSALWGTFLLFACVILYVVCSQGQEVELQSQELRSAIYGLPWFRESPRARRDIVLMIAQANRLIKLNYKATITINMVKYSEVVQTAYSYFMILSSVE